MDDYQVGVVSYNLGALEYDQGSVAYQLDAVRSYYGDQATSASATRTPPWRRWNRR